MKTLSHLIAAAAMLALPILSYAGKPDARARAALALLQKPAVEKNEDCGCGGIDLPCPCGDSCACTACKTHRVAAKKAPPSPIENLTYEIAYQRAVRQNKPLLIWVGETCPSCESTWTSYVHCRCTEYDSPSGAYTGPGVIIGKPDGMGGLDRVATLANIPTISQVQAVLGQQRRTIMVAAPVQQAPVYFAPAPLCLGGPCASGGCCSGGCSSCGTTSGGWGFSGFSGFRGCSGGGCSYCGR